MPNRYHKPRKDANHAQIVSTFRSLGAYVVDIAAVKNAFDIIVYHSGKTYSVEIKDGEKPPSARKLSKGEEECKMGIESVGCEYHVISSVDEAVDLIGKGVS